MPIKPLEENRDMNLRGHDIKSTSNKRKLKWNLIKAKNFLL